MKEKQIERIGRRKKKRIKRILRHSDDELTDINTVTQRKHSFAWT